MRRVLGFAAATLVLLPIAAWADGGSGGNPYFGLRGSYAMADNSTLHANGATASLRAAYDSGEGASFVVGQRAPWLGLRLEAEGIYRHFPLKTITLSGGGGSATIPADVQMGAGMVNALYDVPVDPGFPLKPFLGAGIGGIYTSAKINYPGLNIPAATTWSFGYQLMAGLRIPLSDSVALTAMFRYLSAPNLSFATNLGTPVETSLNSESVDIGLDFGF